MEDGQTLYYDQAVGVIYAGVYDGHGGEQAAEWLTAELHPILLGALKANPPATHADLEDVMTAAFEDADARVIAELERQGRDVLENAGSTATVVMVGRGGQVMVANCGDSQCFVLRGGRAKELTTPHRTYGGGKDVKDELRRVEATGAWIFDGRVCNCLAVSRAFGDWEMKAGGFATLLPKGVERGLWSQKFADSKNIMSAPVVVTPAVSETIMGPDDELLILATDGLWDVVDETDVLQLARSKFRSGQSAQEVADTLVALALQRKSTDNVTVTVIDLKGRAFWDAAGEPPRTWLGQKMEGMFAK